MKTIICGVVGIIVAIISVIVTEKMGLSVRYQFYTPFIVGPVVAFILMAILKKLVSDYQTEENEELPIAQFASSELNVVKFCCPNCGKKIEADVTWKGLTAECPFCHVESIIP